MPADDFGNMWLRGTQVGAGIMSDALNHNLRMQELQSQEVLRRMQERQIAQHVNMQLEDHNRQIQYRADMDKAAGAYAAAVATQGPPVIPAPVGMGPSGMPVMAPVPNPKYRDPVDLATDAFLGPISKYEPEKVPSFLREQAYSKSMRSLDVQREANANWLNERGDIALKGVEATNERNQQRIQARIDELEQKHNNALDILQLTQAHQIHLQGMRNEAKLAISQGEVSREQWMNRHLNTTMQTIQNTRAGAKLPVKEVQSQALQLLGDAWDVEIGSRRGQPASATSPKPSAAPSERRIKVRKPDGKGGYINGSIPESQLKDIPQDWESKEDKG